MISSLEDAEKWYRSVQLLAVYVRHLAGLWDREEIAETLGRDNRLQDVTSYELMEKANTILEDLDDLAVLALFSVFEAAVRARTEADVDREIAVMQHPAVLSAVKDLKDAIQNGSFSKITTAYKSMDTNLTEEVSQVRKYRNWVAHGRREKPRNHNNVAPDQAIDRLRRYLDRLTQIEESATMLPPPPDPASSLEQLPNS